MYPYSIVQWMLFFYCYCFLGWCVESSIVSFKEKRLVNRGFLHSPMLPIYGSGTIMVLVCTIPVREHVMLVYLFGMIGATLLEYITGYGMEKILKVRYWDYSDHVLNLNGHICLSSSLFWGVLSVFMTYVLHNPVEHMIMSLSKWMALAIMTGITIVFLTDFYYSAKVALNFTKLLQKVQEIHEELDALAKLLKEETVDSLKEKSALAIESLKEYSSDVVDSLKEKLPEGLTRQEWMEQLQKLQERKKFDILSRIKMLQEEKHALLKRSHKKGKGFIQKYPSAFSSSFRGAFEEFKLVIEDKLKEMNDRKEK